MARTWAGCREPSCRPPRPAIPHGIVQAGVHALLLDAAMNFAINAALPGQVAHPGHARDEDRDDAPRPRRRLLRAAGRGGPHGPPGGLRRSHASPTPKVSWSAGRPARSCSTDPTAGRPPPDPASPAGRGMERCSRRRTCRPRSVPARGRQSRRVPCLRRASSTDGPPDRNRTAPSWRPARSAAVSVQPSRTGLLLLPVGRPAARPAPGADGGPPRVPGRRRRPSSPARVQGRTHGGPTRALPARAGRTAWRRG